MQAGQEWKHAFQCSGKLLSTNYRKRNHRSQKGKKKKRRKHGNLKGRRQGASCGALECTRGGVLSECGRVARCSYVLSAGPRVFSLKFVPVVR